MNELPLWMEQPPHSGSQTSREAAAAIIPHLTKQRAQVLAYLAGRADGATAQELEDALGMSGNAIRPRLVELRETKCVRDSGKTRKTRSGRNATVWEWVR